MPHWESEARAPVSPRFAGAVLLAFAVGAAVIWFVWIRPMSAHFRWCDRVRTSLKTLAQNQPPELTHDQWEHVVSWTFNLHGNCGTIPGNVDKAWRDGFADELERRLAGLITLADIEWIWDEYAAHTKHGQSYSDKYRPTREPWFLAAVWFGKLGE